MNNQKEQAANNSKKSLIFGIVSSAPIFLLLILGAIILSINYELILIVGFLSIFVMPFSIVMSIMSMSFGVKQLKVQKTKGAITGIILSVIPIITAVAIIILIIYIVVTNI